MSTTKLFEYLSENQCRAYLIHRYIKQNLHEKYEIIQDLQKLINEYLSIPRIKPTVIMS